MNKLGKLPQAMLIILAICAAAGGCSLKATPLLPLTGGLKYSADANGLSQLVNNLPLLPATEQKQQLRAFCSAVSDSRLKHEAAYALARILQKSNSSEDLQEAIGCYKEAATLPELWERCQWHISECGNTLGAEKTVRTALSAIVERGGQGHSLLAARYALGQSYVRTGEREQATQQFNTIKNEVRKNGSADANFALGSEYYLAQMQLSATPAGSPAPDKAIESLLHYLTSSPEGHFAGDTVAQLQQLPGYTPSKEDHNTFARVYYAQGDWKNALDEWHKANNTSLWYKQALCLSHLGKTNEAQKLLTASIEAHPEDANVVPAATMLARLANRNGAIAVWTLVLERCPKFADIALYNLGARAATTAASMDFYRKILNAYPHSSYAPEASWWIAWNDIKTGNLRAALTRLQATTAAYPNANGLARYLYWTGKLQESLGDKTQAQSTYAKTIAALPWHYYAHRAAARQAVLNGGKDRGWSTNPQRKINWKQNVIADWQFPEPPMQLAKTAGATIATLTTLQQWDECLQLLPPSHGLLKAFYLAKLNQPLDAINAAGRSMRGRPRASEGWELAYPLLYAKLICSEAPDKQVDPLLVQALIREESRYNTRALSGSLAVGLMQLMPATAYGVAKRIGIHLDGVEDIHKPDNNLRMGIDYLSYVLHRFNGNALFAVASYNGGPNAVQKWSQSMPADTDVFVENIPFRETRDYVRKVFGSYWNYEQIYCGNRNKTI